LREIAISLASPADCHEIERAIEQAIDDAGLNTSLRASLRKFPGCIHWHLKRGAEPGTLELTFWPRERRAWFTIQDGRGAAWIEEQLAVLDTAIRRRTGIIAQKI
jgi:hypothetical protein